MIESSYALYKLIILYMLQKTNFPLSGGQISDFLLGHGYTSYFHLQEVLTEMEAAGFLQTEKKGNTTYYHMSDRGAETLQYFQEDISPEIREDYNTYLQEHGFEMRSDSAASARYRWLSDQGYVASCMVKEGEQTLLELQISVPTESAARTLCENWKDRCADIYQSLIRQLT